MQPTHLAYVVAAANLHAFNYGLRGGNDMNHYKAVAENVVVPEFTPQSGVKIQVNDNEPVQQEQQGGGGKFSCLSSQTFANHPPS
jgi:ubiquitin-activating enzyme E1